MSSTLDQLKQLTTIVADTGDFESMRAYQPQDATTNPSLILKALGQEQYGVLLEEAVERAAAEENASPERVADHLITGFGRRILGIVPGRVSTEVDAQLSFDTAATVAKARDLIALYEDAGVPRERILIKIASTWEGAAAARVLEEEGIHCNMTLLFSLVQAVACAEAGATLISPFVGRILDWYKAETGNDYAAAEDPGVESVREIYAYYKHHGYKTEVMGASFRNTGEILELAGCDLLTISPSLLEELGSMDLAVERKLDPEKVRPVDRLEIDEKTFRWLLNEDAMATEKLAQGIRVFGRDMRKVLAIIEDKLGVTA